MYEYKESLQQQVAKAVRAFEKIEAGKVPGIRNNFTVVPTASFNKCTCELCGEEIPSREEHYLISKSKYADIKDEHIRFRVACYTCTAPFVGIDNPVACALAGSWFDNGKS